MEAMKSAAQAGLITLVDSKQDVTGFSSLQVKVSYNQMNIK
jgi:hypothetical protein